MNTDGADGDDMPGFLRCNDPHRLDPDTTERLAGGAIAPDDVPPRFRPLAGLLAAAAVAPHAEELSGEAAAAAAFVATFEKYREPHPTSRRKPMLVQVLTTKVAAGVFAGTLLVGGGVAAAAAGNLPDGAQDVVHTTLSHVGVDVPDSAGKGKTVSSVAHDPANSGPGKGEAVCTVASEGKCQAGDHGQAGEHGKAADSNKPADPGRPADPGSQGRSGTPGQGAGGRPEDPGKPADAGQPAEAGKPADAGQPDEAGKPADAGRPEGAGRSGGAASQEQPAGTGSGTAAARAGTE
jgi:hypothetical protein